MMNQDCQCFMVFQLHMPKICREVDLNGILNGICNPERSQVRRIPDSVDLIVIGTTIQTMIGTGNAIETRTVIRTESVARTRAVIGAKTMIGTMIGIVIVIGLQVDIRTEILVEIEIRIWIIKL